MVKCRDVFLTRRVKSPFKRGMGEGADRDFYPLAKQG